MTLDSLREACLKLIERAPAAYLTTIAPNGYPHTRAMLNLRNRRQYPAHAHLFSTHQEDLLIYFTTNTSSGKIKELNANPKASVYYCDPSRFHGVMLAGDLHVVDDPLLRRDLWTPGWERYYPGGPDDPDHTILALLPTLVTGWHRAARFSFDPRG